MGDKMLVYGAPESRWGQYFEYGVLSKNNFVKIIKARSVYGNSLDTRYRIMVCDSDIIKVGGMVE